VTCPKGGLDHRSGWPPTSAQRTQRENRDL
jgi:hypothetical protein